MQKNKKIILIMLITVILVGGISVYATYSYLASEVSYTKDGEKISVQDALDQLYSNYKRVDQMQLFCGNGYSQIQLVDSMYKKYSKIKIVSTYVLSGSCTLYYQDNLGNNLMEITPNKEYDLLELINNGYIKLTHYNPSGWSWTYIEFYN